jgi:phage shock protein PspC (stress-responsive transcriptional regulator)
MKRERILIILGVLTALAPFYGLPSSYMTVLLILFGLGVAYIGYTLQKKDQETG